MTLGRASPNCDGGVAVVLEKKWSLLVMEMLLGWKRVEDGAKERARRANDDAAT